MPFVFCNRVIFMTFKTKIKGLPVVYMSPVFGLVRKGRKSLTWLLMCSAARDRSSFTLMINTGYSKTEHSMYLLWTNFEKLISPNFAESLSELQSDFRKHTSSNYRY